MTRKVKQTTAILLFIFTLLIGFKTIVFADASSGDAKTEVRGYIDSDTTWTASKSPYYITGKITVAEGATLTIEPGVTVYFADEYYPCDLKVYGNLILKGTTDNKITLQYVNNKVTGGAIFNNINGQTIENVDCKVPITLNGSNNIIQNSSVRELYTKGDYNTITNCTLNYNYSSNNSYNLVEGNYNKISKSKITFYYNKVYVKGNYNKIIQNTIGDYYSGGGSLYLEQNNNSFHHNNIGVDNVYTQKQGLVNVRANYNGNYVRGADTNSTPIYSPVSNNQIDITKDLTFDGEVPVLKSYIPSKTQAGVNEDVTLSVRLTDDSNIFGVFWVKDETSGFFKNNQFTYDDKTDTYSIAIHYDKEGVYKLPMLALIDDYNNITYVDVAKYQSGKFNKSITVGTSAASTNANLKSISINGTAVANFSSSNKTYNVTIPKTTTVNKLNVQAIGEDSAAAVSVSGDTLVNGAASIKIIVTAQDGTTQNTYTINATKESDTSTGNTSTKGDVNSDGKVTVMDAVKIAKFVIGSDTLTDVQKLVADFNGDGKITIMDAQSIAKYVIGQ
jgi:hypothetical protein